MAYVQVIESGDQRKIAYDLETRLFKDNIIKLDDEITPWYANEIQNQLLYLQTKLDPKSSDPSAKTIKIYINSPGGSVYDGLGIYDLMQLLINQGYIIETVNMGSCCSMAAILLMAGSKGHRRSLEHARIMIHEMSSWIAGKTPHVKEEYEEVVKLQEILDSILKKHACEDLIKMEYKTDKWFSATEGIQYNIIDNIIEA